MQNWMSDRAAPGSVVSTKSTIAAGASAVSSSSTLGRIRYSSRVAVEQKLGRCDSRVLG